jgi:hypothetical protein
MKSGLILPDEKFRLSNGQIHAASLRMRKRAIAGAVLFIAGWVLRHPWFSGATMLQAAAWAASVASIPLVLTGISMRPTLRGYRVYIPLALRSGSTITLVLFLALGVWAILANPVFLGWPVQLWTIAAFLVFSLLPILLTRWYLMAAERYVRRPRASHGLKASAFLDVGINPMIHAARLRFHLVSTPLCALAALVDWRLTAILVWHEADRRAVMVRLMRPPFALFLTGSFQTAEDDMLTLRFACGGHTMMHLVVSPDGRLPSHPRLSEDTFRLLPEAASLTAFGDWTGAVEFQMQNCGVILLDGSSISEAFRTELLLVERNELQWKTLVVDRTGLHPEVAATMECWRGRGTPAGVYDVSGTAALLTQLAQTRFPPEPTPVWRLAKSIRPGQPV